MLCVLLECTFTCVHGSPVYALCTYRSSTIQSVDVSVVSERSTNSFLLVVMLLFKLFTAGQCIN